jgi:hypothetical protein
MSVESEKSNLSIALESIRSRFSHLDERLHKVADSVPELVFVKKTTGLPCAVLLRELLDYLGEEFQNRNLGCREAIAELREAIIQILEPIQECSSDSALKTILGTLYHDALKILDEVESTIDSMEPDH